MQKRPIISFCLPTFNRSECAVNCVNTILQYKGDDIEVVVSNNCSEDDTLYELQKINDSRLKLFSNATNIGFKNNFLLTLERATGEFCFTLSDEDEIFYDRISELVKLAKKTKANFICTSIMFRRYHPDTMLEEDIVYRKIGFKHITDDIFYNIKKRQWGITKSLLAVEKNRISKKIDAKIRQLKSNGEYDANKLKMINKIFGEGHITGYLYRRDKIPFDLINSSKCPELAVFPHVFIGLMLNVERRAEFNSQVFSIATAKSNKTHPLYEEVAKGKNYAHPLSVLQIVKYRFEWIRLLQLTDLERKDALVGIFRRGLRNSVAFTDFRVLNKNNSFTQIVETKLPKSECFALAEDYIKNATKNIEIVKSADEYETLLIKYIDDFTKSVFIEE